MIVTKLILANQFQIYLNAHIKFLDISTFIIHYAINQKLTFNI